VFASTATLALFYVGAAYLVALAWAAVLHDLINDPTEEGRARAARRAGGYLVAGAVHPLFALAAWDIARQVDGPGLERDAPCARLRSLAPVVAAVSASCAAVLFALAGR